MASDYTTSALVKAALGITDSSEDTAIAARVTAASRLIDRHCHRRFFLDAAASARIINPHRRVIARDDGEHLMVDDIGTTTGLVVEVGSSSTSWTAITTSIEAEPTDALSLDPAEPITSLLYEDNYFTSHRRVRVTAKWGWPAVPDVVGEAALIQATRLYRRKDSPEGVLGAAEWSGAVRLSRVDPDVAALLSTLVVLGVG